MRRFQEAGIRRAPKFGQKFLIDLNLLDVLFARPPWTKTTWCSKWERAPDR